MVAGVVVALRHLARPVESMLVLPGAEVDHVPTVSGVSGQLPLTLEAVANCTSSSGGAARWSEMALIGVDDGGDGAVIVVESAATAVHETLRKIVARKQY